MNYILKDYFRNYNKDICKRMLITTITTGVCIVSVACAKPDVDTSTATSTDNIIVDVEDTGAVHERLSDAFISSTADTLSDVAMDIIHTDVVPFELSVFGVEEGLLTGFGNTEITGFKEAYQISPMIGSVPFVGYLFELNDDIDSNRFVSHLKENADLRWNICTEADNMSYSVKGNRIFFLMANNEFEE